jgi:hypothetical protein
MNMDEKQRKKMDTLIRATANLHMDKDASAQESILVLLSLACVIAHEICEPEGTLQQLLSQSYAQIGSGAERNPIQ